MKHLKNHSQTARKRSNRRTSDWFWIATGIVVVLLVALTTIGSMSLAIATQETIARGIKVEGISLDGLTRQEAYAKVRNVADDRLKNSEIHLVYNDSRWNIPAEEINLTIDVNKAIDEAYTPGHTGSLLQRLTENLQCYLDGKYISFTVDYDGNLLDQRLQQVAADIKQAPVSATCYFGPNLSIVRTPAILGQELNTDELVVDLNRKLLDLNMPDEIVLEPALTQPPITDADLASMDSILASYTTTYGAGGNRGTNIQIAAQAINASFVRPNGEFSFNSTVGYRTPSNGYRSAPVIIGGKMDIDYGGGVCQVSSTLYNAILLAGLNATERSRHYFPSSYVPLGQDATVADGAIDFKFRNHYPHGIYLLTGCYAGNLTVYVIGCGADMQGKTYDLKNYVIRGGAAPVVAVERIIYQNGAEIAREDLHTDYYDPPQTEET